jgi:hypothetical protein
MYTTDVALFRAMNGYLGKLVADLDDADLDAQPAPGMNTPRWILAHLAICNDYTAGFFGETNPLCPGDWHAAYGPDSRPNDPTAVKPHKDELLKQIAAGAERVARLASAGLPAGAADQPNPFESIRAAFPTVGVLIAHLLTTHIAVHLGQLSAWRRAGGRPAV